MKKISAASLAALAALLLAGSALAQMDITPNPPSVEAARADRHCTSTPLSAAAAAECPTDVLNDGPRPSPAEAHPSANSMQGTGNMGGGFAMPGGTGAASTGAMGTSISGETSMGAAPHGSAHK